MLEKARLCVASVISLLVSTGCVHGDVTDVNQSGHTEPSGVETVVVKRGSITPTLSVRSRVAQTSRYVLESPQRGDFEPFVKVGDQVEAGQVLGRSAGEDVQSPAKARVTRVLGNEKDLPQNYPLLELEYSGFSLEVHGENFFGAAGTSKLHGKFQVREGVGPTECSSVVQAAGEADSSTGDTADLSEEQETARDGTAQVEQTKVSANPQVFLCLIAKDVPVKAGQEATVVLTALKRENVILVPVSAVAGRADVGQVYLVSGSETQKVEVKLGASDGANIEILSGLEEGATISSASPDLDPRRK